MDIVRPEADLVRLALDALGQLGIEGRVLPSETERDRADACVELARAGRSNTFGPGQADRAPLHRRAGGRPGARTHRRASGTGADDSPGSASADLPDEPRAGPLLRPAAPGHASE